MATKIKKDMREQIEYKRAVLDVVSDILDALERKEDAYTRYYRENETNLTAYRADNPNATEDDWTLQKYLSEAMRDKCILNAVRDIRLLLETVVD